MATLPVPCSHPPDAHAIPYWEADRSGPFLLFRVAAFQPGLAVLPGQLHNTCTCILYIVTGREALWLDIVPADICELREFAFFPVAALRSQPD